MAEPALFNPIRIRNLNLSNRIVIAPMCQYSAENGCMNDWHLIHLGHLAVAADNAALHFLRHRFAHLGLCGVPLCFVTPSHISNEFRAHLLEQVHRRALQTGDARLRELEDELRDYPGGDSDPLRG